MTSEARESIWEMQVPLGAALLLAALGFLLGFGMGGTAVQLDPFAGDHPAEPPLAKLLVWGAAFAIGWGCRQPVAAWIATPRPSLPILLALAFVPVALADMLASQFAIAISGYPTCAPGALPLPPFLSFMPRAVLLGSGVLLALRVWGRHLARRAATDAWEVAPVELPMPTSSGHAPDWLHLPEAPLLRLRVADVMLIRSAGNYSEIVALGRAHLVRATLTDLAHRYAALGFVRIHRQAIVNARQVRLVSRDTQGRIVVQLACGTPIPLGRRYRDAVDALR